jgi:predicted RNA binding protein YcfA (HicA-like mRNA interferase family)
VWHIRGSHRRGHVQPSTTDVYTIVPTKPSTNISRGNFSAIKFSIAACCLLSTDFVF